MKIISEDQYNYVMKNKKSDRDEIVEGDIIGVTDELSYSSSPSMTFSAGRRMLVIRET